MFVKQFTIDDWQEYKAIRLEALAALTKTSMADRTHKDPRRTFPVAVLLVIKNAFFGLYEGGALIGCAGVVTDRSDKTERTALLIGSYIREDFRGRKLSRLLYAARI